MRYIDYLFANTPTLFTSTISFILVVLLGFFDYITGAEISFSVFYLLPITLCSWYAGTHIGLFCACLSAITWFWVDFYTHTYSQNWIPFWNAMVRMSFFGLTSYLLSQLKMRLSNEEKLARTDGLTGLLNQSFFRQKLSIDLKLSIRYKDPFAIGYIDLDNFKKVNDTKGHAEGDKVLITVAQILFSSCRETDTVSRLGGDEFAIFLPRTDSKGARVFFDSLYEKLVNKTKNYDWGIGFSIGVAIFTEPKDIDILLSRADKLMYRVKKNEKNNVIYEIVD